ncbi:MerR family transcriptional regulator [Alteromonas gracilis]
MRIGQLAETIDLPTSTIRFYEQKGLISLSRTHGQRIS